MEIKQGDKVALVIGRSTEIGFRVAVNGTYEGMLYHNEIFQPVEEGDQVDGYVKKIREDGRVDVSLQPQGFLHVIDSNMNIIEEKLRSGKGVLKLNDKSSPEEIHQQLKMSKKAFKSAVGKLYKLQKIRIEEDGIYLIK